MVSKQALIREIEIKEEGIEKFLAEREGYEYDLDEEGISLATKRLIQKEIDRIDGRIWNLKTGIMLIENKLKRGRYL